MRGQCSRVFQRQSAVQRCLPAEAQQDAVGLFLGDHPFDILRRYRKKIDFVGEAFGGLDRGNVGIDQNDAKALFAKGFDRLTAGVVELAGLTDGQCGAAENEYGRHGLAVRRRRGLGGHR